MPSLDENSATIQKVVHDLRGPLVNLEGFFSELDESVIRMVGIMEECRDHLPQNASGSLDAIIKDDLTPILRLLSSSINQLNERVDLLVEDTNINTK